MRVLLVLFVLLISGPAHGQSDSEAATGPDVTIRTYFEPEGDIYIGQLVRLWIEVTTSSSWFTMAPRYPELQLDGAIVLMPEQLGVNFTDREGGETRTGQRQRYAIIPQRVGTLAIPSLKVTLGVSVDGKKSGPIILRTKPVSLTTILPPGTEQWDQILTTQKLSVEERYDREFDDLKVGDAITRTVTLRSDNTFALALPKVAFGPVTGARSYPAQPKLNDKVNRGQYRATRTDSVTYVLEREGEVRLSEIAVRWWNPDSKTVEEAVLPSAGFTVAANPDYRNNGGPIADRRDTVQDLKRWTAATLAWLRTNIAWLTLAAIGLYIAVLVWRRFAPLVFAHWEAWRLRRGESESRYFRDFRKACRSGDEDGAIASFWRWLDRLTPDDQAASLGRLTRAEGDAEFREFVQDTGKNRYSGRPANKHNEAAIYSHVARFRQRLVRHKNTPATDVCRTLNPQSSVRT